LGVNDLAQASLIPVSRPHHAFWPMLIWLGEPDALRRGLLGAPLCAQCNGPTCSVRCVSCADPFRDRSALG